MIAIFLKICWIILKYFRPETFRTAKKKKEKEKKIIKKKKKKMKEVWMVNVPSSGVSSSSEQYPAQSAGL